MITLTASALQTFRGVDDVSPDLDEMEYDLEQQEKEPEWNFKQLLASPMLRLPLILVCSLAMLQQLSGINFVSERINHDSKFDELSFQVFYYSSSVFENGGVPQESSQYATLGVCFINFLMTGISVRTETSWIY